MSQVIAQGADADCVLPASAICPILSLPLDQLAPVFGYLLPLDQSRLRSTCQTLVAAFNCAVELERFVSLAGSENPKAACPQQENDACSLTTATTHWFPLDISGGSLGKRSTHLDNSQPMFSHIPKSLTFVITGPKRKKKGVRFVDWLRADDSHTFSTLRQAPGVVSIRVRCGENAAGFMPSSFLENATELETLDIDFPDASSRIPDNFASGCKRLRRVQFGRCVFIKEIGSSFLHDCASLTSLNLDVLKKVNSVGERFLSGAADLPSVNLTMLSGLTTLRASFLQGCASLQTLGCSAFLAVTRIEDDFAEGCRRLVAVDLSGFGHVRFIGNGFLRNCESIVDVDMTAMNSLSSIGSEFLRGNSSLVLLKLGSLQNVTAIGASFLEDCRSLKHISFCSNDVDEPLPGIKTINQNFLQNCDSLLSLDLRPFANVTAIRDNFLNRCAKVAEIDLSPLSKVRMVGCDFLARCQSLASIDLSPMKELHTIDTGCLAYCGRLRVVNASGLAPLQQIGPWFAYTCGSLLSVSLSEAPMLKSIGQAFLASCASLQSLNLEGTGFAVVDLGGHFLQGCRSLHALALPFPQLKVLPYRALAETRALQRLDISVMESLSVIETGFVESDVPAADQVLHCIVVTSPENRALVSQALAGRPGVQIQ